MTKSGARAAGPRRAVAAGHAGELDPIITMDSGGTIQSASDSIEPLFGWTPAELCGQNVSVLIREPRRSALDRYLDRYREPGRARPLNRVGRFDAVRKDGTGVRIELSVSRADLPGHVGAYFVGLIRDVSGQIETQPDSPRERTRLQRFITEQTRALATAHLRLQLADRLASLGTLAAGLGHDLNNVLLPVRARLNAIEHAGLSAPARKHLDAVRHCMDYLQHLSDGLHFMSLDPRGNGDDQEVAAPTHLATWWTQVGGLLRAAVPKAVLLNARLPSALPSAAIASHLLTQAMLNLIVNAGESFPAGRRGARVTIRAEAVARTEAHAVLAGPSLRLSVIDNGRGMTPQVRRKALDPFFTTKPRALGTGLGLPLVAKIVARVGGHLMIHSRPAHGTTITLTLPVASAQAASGRRAVLTIGDRHRAMLVAQMLAAAGYGLAAELAQATGTHDLWVTRHSPAALRSAARWKRAGGARCVVVCGARSTAAARAWRGLGAQVMPERDDLTSLRAAILAAAATGARSTP